MTFPSDEILDPGKKERSGLWRMIAASYTGTMFAAATLIGILYIRSGIWEASRQAQAVASGEDHKAKPETLPAGAPETGPGGGHYKVAPETTPVTGIPETESSGLEGLASVLSSENMPADLASRSLIAYDLPTKGRVRSIAFRAGEAYRRNSNPDGTIDIKGKFYYCLEDDRNTVTGHGPHGCTSRPGNILLK